ncbi:unnamed protein product [Jaminaea pallidilutea]
MLPSDASPSGSRPRITRAPVSPPTPAPSPRPQGASFHHGAEPGDMAHQTLAAGSPNIMPPLDHHRQAWSMDPQSLTRAATALLPTLPSSARITLLSDLLMLLSSQELAQISSFVSSRLRIDFLSALPIEVSLHVLSYIDDPLTLARASQVSRFWRSLVNDEHTWEAMCLKYRYRYRRPSVVYPRAQSSASGGRDADLLASLYQRYRQRGLDPSNARNELRTLHDLFLAKQTATLHDATADQDRGEGSSHTRSSKHRLIAQSTAQVREMSSADLQFYEQLEQIVQEESRARYGKVDASSGQASHPISSNPASSSQPTSPPLGWLSAGQSPSTLPLDTRARSRLSPLSGVGATTSFQASRRSSAPSSSNETADAPADVSAGSPAWSSGLALPWGLGGLISFPSSLSAANPRLSSIALSSLPTTSTQQLRTAHTTVTRAAHPDSAAWDDPFSYKAHFKRNYLTEANWRRGGRLLTHHISAESGSVCTYVAMDERWIVVGMANGRIHLFDARTGLYERTLLGRHSSGVWCLSLVSKTSKTKTRQDRKSAQSTSGKGKTKASAGENHPRAPYVRDSTGAIFTSQQYYLKLLAHDPRLSHLIDGQTSADDPGTGAASSSKTRQEGSILHWFHRARAAMNASESSEDSRPNHPEPTRQARPTDPGGRISGGEVIDGYSRDLLEAGPDFVRESIMSVARRRKPNMAREEKLALEQEVADLTAELDRIREAHGITGKRRIPRPRMRDTGRDGDGDAVMGGIGDDEGGDTEDADDADDADEASSDSEDEYDGFSMGIGGTSQGLGTLCSSTRGFGNDSALLVSGGCDREVKVWDLETGELKFSMRGHQATVRCLRVLEGRPIAVSGGRDFTVRVWDISTGTMLRVLAGHLNSVRCIELAGNRAATGSYDCTCRIWDVDTGECLSVLRGHYNQIYCIGFDGNKVATGSLDSTVRVWSAETGEALALLQGHTDLVGQLQLSNDILISGGSDGRVIAYSLAPESLRQQRHRQQQQHLQQAQQSHSSRRTITAASLPSVSSAGTRPEPVTFAGTTGVQSSPSALAPSTSTPLPLPNLQLLYTICAHDNSVSSLQFDEHFILTGGNDGTVRLWNVADGSFVRELARASQSVWKVAFREDRVLWVAKQEDDSLSMGVVDFRPTEGTQGSDDQRQQPPQKATAVGVSI